MGMLEPISRHKKQGRPELSGRPVLAHKNKAARISPDSLVKA
jgi:hypothetical protein